MTCCGKEPTSECCRNGYSVRSTEVKPVSLCLIAESSSPLACRDQLAIDLRREFTAVMAEAEAKSSMSGGATGSIMGSVLASITGSIDLDDAEPVAADLAEPQLQSVLPLLSLTTTALSFSTLTQVLFRIAFRYK